MMRKEIPCWWIEHMSVWSVFISRWAFGFRLPLIPAWWLAVGRQVGDSERCFLCHFYTRFFPFLFFFFLYTLIMDGFMKSYDCHVGGTKRLGFMIPATLSLSGVSNSPAPIPAGAQSWLVGSA
ncbi:hypothetical protein BT67DRAFT_89727 [Trichocladium antarcticum]|uniref:Uncharacterized protein n=1 Tax=Trichocladium antarcticum TaxID=1450529 RepID=A0AAN6UG74_9PEZI|nr:hypothetical protein BT67DRAFT_89727 [Trichocladium antarcticum]